MATTPPARRGSLRPLITGIFLGALLMLLGILIIGMPLAVGHRQDLPLERLYGDFAVGIAARTQAGSATNPLANNRRAIETGRLAYTGSCAVCHGASGDGNSAFGKALYPPATNLQQHDTQEKSDAELFWIIKNGISFVGMPGFAERYQDEDIWALVAYTRSLGTDARRGAEIVPTPSTEQLVRADPSGSAEQRGGAVYYAQGCYLCHGPVGNAPGELGLGGGREAAEAVRRGKKGMPAFGKEKISDAQLQDLIAYLNSFRRG